MFKLKTAGRTFIDAETAEEAAFTVPHNLSRMVLQLGIGTPGSQQRTSFEINDSSLFRVF